MWSVKKEGDKSKSDLKSEELSNSYKLVADYYLHQGIVSEDSCEKFIDVLKSPQDSTYYVASRCSHVKKIKPIFKALLELLKTRENFATYPTPLSWFNDECIWRWKLNKGSVPHEDCYIELRKFLYQQKACDYIIRQDALDMIPLLLLKANPSMKVLDMCGHSHHKFHQLADILHLRDEIDGDGLFVVVESDLKRCMTMSDSFSKHSSPRFCVANLNAKLLPLMVTSTSPADPTSGTASESFLTFDRVLCFLPSSNDGLARNNPETVRGWTWSASLSHHGNLCEMLNSGLGVLSVGGRLVYAVNSMNPIEGEAVISTVLYQQKGSVKLLDVSSDFPDIVYEKGLTKWEVLTNQKWYANAEEVPEYLWTQVWTSMFPLSSEITDKQHLERCLRILPHKQNTSGIFVAVLSRVEYLEDACMREEEEERRIWEEGEVLRKKKMEEEAVALEEKRKRKLERKRRKLELKEAKAASSAGLADTRSDPRVSDNVQDDSKFEEVTAKEGADRSGEVEIKTRQVDEEEKIIVENSGVQKSGADNDTKNLSLEKNEAHEKEEVKSTVESESQEQNGCQEVHWSVEHQDECHYDVDAESPSFPVKIEHISDAPVEFLEADNPFITEIRTFYGLMPDFPQHLLCVKMFEDIPFYYYLVSDALEKLLRMNSSAHKFVGAGVKVFAYMSHEDVDCRFRITQEGAKYIFPYMTRQIVQVSKKDVISVLSKSEIELYNLTSSLQNRLSRIDRGSFMIYYEPSQDDLDDPLILSCMKAGNIFKCYLSEYQRYYYLRLLGVPFKSYDDSQVTVKEALLSFAKHFKDIKA